MQAKGYISHPSEIVVSPVITTLEPILTFFPIFTPFSITV